MLSIEYRESDRRALLSWSPTDEASPWLPIVQRLIQDTTDDARQEGAAQLSLPWWVFSGLRERLLAIFKGHGLVLGKELSIGTGAYNLLTKSTQNTQSYQRAASAEALEAGALLAQLRGAGFDNPQRPLTEQQLRNICKLAALPSGATFSVPGAGKTTEALAFFFSRATSEQDLLVIAPKNAFAAWEEQLSECVPKRPYRFVRLRGGHERIARLLDDKPRFALITYQQLTRVRELVAGYLAQHPSYVILDESHRIKSGIEKATAQAVLSFAHLPVGKLVMSGTPMPQAVEDLLPQFAFLYPELPATRENVVELIRPIYVRTTKAELGLPPVERVLTQLSMAPVQAELYSLMKYEVAREAKHALSIPTRQALRTLGKSVARLLQFVSHPALLSSHIGFAQPDLLRAVLAEGDGPKLEYLLKKVRHVAGTGQKVLVWSSFVRNVEYIANRLSDLGAVYIHGGVDAGDEDDDESREGKIRLFHDNKNVRVMVANPAAASEGISLHRICHFAIYLDRTFNAAHYLQSEDRIHRIGLKPTDKTIVEIVECEGTIDETVRHRLGFKVAAMAAALNDTSLSIDPVPMDPLDLENPDEAVGMSEGDVLELLRDVTKSD